MVKHALEQGWAAVAFSSLDRLATRCWEVYGAAEESLDSAQVCSQHTVPLCCECAVVVLEVTGVNEGSSQHTAVCILWCLPAQRSLSMHCMPCNS